MEQPVLAVCNYVDVIGSYCYTYVAGRVLLKSVVKLCLQHSSRTVQPKYLSLCSAFYGELFPEPGKVAYNAVLCTKAVFIKWGYSNFARTVWGF